MTTEKQSLRKRQKKKGLPWGRIVLVLLLTVLLVGGAYAAKLFLDLNATIEQVNQTSVQEGTGKIEVKKIRPKEVSLETGDPINILLLGTDDDGRGRDADQGYVSRSDSMMILSLNPKTRTTKMLSIPRDIYTDIQGQPGPDKINHAYAFGGVDLSIDTVQNFLNVPIDYYAVVNMQGLEQLVDAVGGIEITSPLTFTYQESSFIAGETKHVDGWNAMNFARMRYDDPEGETGRQNRQKLVIKALVDKLSGVGTVANFPQLLEVVAKNVKTNLDLKQVLDIYQKYSPALQNITAIRFEDLEDLYLDEIYYYYAPISSRLKVANDLRLNSGLTPITANQLKDPLGDNGGAASQTVSKTAKLIINQYPTGFTTDELEQVSQTQDNAQNIRQAEYYNLTPIPAPIPTPVPAPTENYDEVPVQPQNEQSAPLQPAQPASPIEEQPAVPVQPSQPANPVTPPPSSGNDSPSPQAPPASGE